MMESDAKVGQRVITVDNQNLGTVVQVSAYLLVKMDYGAVCVFHASEVADATGE